MNSFEHTPQTEPARSDAADAQTAPQAQLADGCAVAPFLDVDGRNVPNKKGQRPPWTKKQWNISRIVLDRLRFWLLRRYQCLWVTLTSAPGSPKDRLRKDFQTLRKRAMRYFGYDPIQYVCVDTIEGHGVLHMIWAWRDPDPKKKASFYIPFEWLQEQWKDIHGAFHVNVKRIRPGNASAKRLSRYIVAQYCGGQSGLVRVSQSRGEFPITEMRKALLNELRHMPERYEAAKDLLHLSTEEFGKQFRGLFWAVFRAAWDELAVSQTCEAFGIRFVWIGKRLERL
jgi:hypothetical protein